MHWHQPHLWSEIARAGLAVELGEDAQVAGWFVGNERRSGTLPERDAIAERGWPRVGSTRRRNGLRRLA